MNQAIKKIGCSGGKKCSVYCSHTELVLTDIINGNPRNPNTHPDSQISLLGKVILSQGWRAPITISKRSGIVVKGHGRLDAAKLIGCEKCPVDYQEYETEADEIADMLADNKLAELSNIDSELELSSKQFLTDEEFDLELAGFCSFNLEDCEDEAPESFNEIDDNLKTDKKCPKCGYEWS